jgi:hypothetical protein
MVLGEIIIPEDLKDNNTIQSIKDKPLLKIKTDKEIDSNIPTLIIGWKNVENMCNETEKSILNKKIKENLFWTFSYDENTQDFNEDIESFIDKLYDDLIKDIKYIFIDPVIDKLYDETDLINYINISINLDNIYITEDFIYIYDEQKKIISGIDINYCKFFKFDIEKIIAYINLESRQTLIEDYTNTGVYQTYKNYLNKEIDKKYIVLIANKLIKSA